ncbi:7TM diverse intracellular signaling domain-containing protein [Emticicia fluvialis]|uniref:7TM diverse intracellular signaling domain-containing protein n=1 Tax=Emticicia fluvialis TaxID=2974474 RepID=UPI0036F1E70A
MIKMVGVLKRLTIWLSSITVVVILLFLILHLSFYQYRYFTYLLIFCLCSLTFVLVFRSIKRKYKPAWLFLFATVPVLCISVLETFSDLHHIPVQLMHTIYYSATVFEMFVLTLGLALRFKIAQYEKKKL